MNALILLRRASVCSGILLAVPALAQPAVPQQTATAGLWTAFASSDHATCGIATTGSDGRRIAVQQHTGETGLTVTLDKPTWAIPDGTSVDVGFQFDGGPAIGEQAVGSGEVLTIAMPFDRSVAFMRSLRSGSEVRVYFPSGNESQWTGGLSGSSAMIDAFNTCRGSLTATTGPTQPFTSSPPASQPAAQTQPAIPPKP